MAIVLENSDSYQLGFGNDTESFNINVGSGNDRLLLYIHQTEGNVAGLGCTASFNGVAMTQVSNAQVSRYGQIMRVQVFALYDSSLPASTGNYNLSTTALQPEYHHQGHFVLLSGVDQAAALGITKKRKPTGGSANSIANTIGEHYFF